jgi:transposase
MKKVVKQVLGIDVAQAELVCCFGKMHDDFATETISYKTFVNSSKGFDALLTWVNKLQDESIPVRYVMEATGIYHESLAYFLHEKSMEVSIILPNKISNYARTLDTKTVTDKTSSEAIMLFGLERKLDNWEPPKGIYKKLQQLTRERCQLTEEQTVIKNQIHAEESEAHPHQKSIARAKKRLALIKKQIDDIISEIKEMIETNDEVKKIIVLLCSIPGIGMITAATILGETNGFNLIRNRRQLTSYAGLDVKEKQSGTSVKGKPRISKRGNRQLRQAMHMPALTAIRYDERFKAIFTRLLSKHGIKMKAVVAVQRKLLEMTFTVFKTKTNFNKDYNKAEDLLLEQVAG